MIKSSTYFFLIAFLEGASVMAIELAGARMLAPFYGTSMYVWAAILAVTLGGLTTGYYFGGWASSKYKGGKLLFSVLIAGAVLVALMPLMALKIVPAFQGLGLRGGALASALTIIYFPLLCMGMVSPILIQLQNTAVNQTGKTAGSVYAISTIGGIFMTLLMGFYLLPEWGIRASIYLTAALLFLAALLATYAAALKKGGLFGGLGLIAILFLASVKQFANPDIDLKFLSQSEGIMGQVTVLDNPHPETNRMFRLLMINQIPQTQDNVAILPISGWSYPHRLATLASIKPKGSRVLLVGMGGGNIAMELKKMGFTVDIAEIDSRMPGVAEKYFGFTPDSIAITIDDGRHYIRNTSQKYDLVLTDVLNGEVQPYHMFTREAFAELKKVLEPDALVLINFQGYIIGEHGRAARSIYNTLQNAGFHMQYYFSGDAQNDGDLHFIASMGHPDYHAIEESRLNDCCKVMPHKEQDLVTAKPIDLFDALVFTDDKPQLELMNAYATEIWRKRTIETYLVNLPGYKIPFFQ